MEMNYKEKALLFKALSDETRLKIIDILSCGELCACVILENFQITQPTLSYHMKILSSCNLVTGRKSGSWIHYTLNSDKMKELAVFCETVSLEKEDCICKSKK